MSDQDNACLPCTVIICTMGLAQRAASLKRAIESVRAGNRRMVEIIVVVNGQEFDHDLIRELRMRSDIRLLQLPVASFAAAILAGRQAVLTPVFGYLDDDDEFLPGAVDQRMEVFANHRAADMVVTNGYRSTGGTDVVALKNLGNVVHDPLLALYQENWLASCGAFFRSQSVTAEVFGHLPRHIHWSWLAFCLIQANKKVAILDRPTFRIHDTVDSASKSETYILCHIEIYSRMHAVATRPEIKRIVRRRLTHAWHVVSDFHRLAGSGRLAWIAHLRSLSHPSGWKFMPYSLRLLGFPGK